MATSTGSGDYDVVVGPYNANASTIIATGHTVTLTDNVTGNNFFQIQAGATLVGGGFSITVDNESSSDLTFLNAGTISGVLDVIITNPNGVAAIDFTGEGGNVRNLTINHASCVATIQDNTTLDGDLTITAGELNTKSGSNHALTVTGDVSVTGTLTGNASAVSLGSLTINSGGTYSATSGTTTITGIESGASRSVLNSGTLTHNSGTFLFNGDMDQKISTNSTGRFNNITLNKSNNDFVFIDSSTTVEGNLDITMGDNTRQCRPSSTSGTITVLGNVIVREGIMLRSANDCSGNMEFGGLILESGGIYGTTSGTTKINGALRNIGGTIN